jgi:asparagine synthase (glutamine-hydrolysing)
LEQWSTLYDEPFGDHAGIPTYLLSCMARERVTVALSADGGDEEFCGYSGYSEFAQRMADQARLPRAARALGAGALGVVEAIGPFGFGGSIATGLNRAMGAGLACDRLGKMRTFLGADSGLDAVRPFNSRWQTGELRRLLDPGYQDPRVRSLKWKGAPLEQIAALDFHEYLPDDVLTKTDRATMAAGLEGREPLLDHRVVEMAYRLPLAMRYGALGPKHALRSILYRHVPRELVDRPKHGFDVPLRSWMAQFIADGTVRESLAVLSAKLGFDARQMQGVLTTFAGSDQGRNRLWLLHTLGLWAERWA